MFVRDKGMQTQVIPWCDWRPGAGRAQGPALCAFLGRLRGRASGAVWTLQLIPAAAPVLPFTHVAALALSVQVRGLE